MANRSISQPLGVYATVISLALALSVVTLCSLVLVSTVRADREAVGIDAALRLEPVLAAPHVRRAVRIMLLSASGCAILAGLCSWWLSTRVVLAPLRDLQRLIIDRKDEDSELAESPASADEVVSIAHAYRQTMRIIQRERAQLVRRGDELAQAYGQLSRSSQLASVGTLAAGVAHEIGNPLAAVMGYLRLAEKDLTPDERAEILSRSLRELSRIHTIISRLLAYSRSSQIADEAETIFSAARVVRETIALVRLHPALAGVTVETDLGEDSEDVRGHEQSLMQVLSNLLINAGQALAGRGDPRIRIEKRVEQTTIAIVVRDNGPGIPAAALEKIFDPFYTTKPIGTGTGLGLAVSRALLQAMGGDITAHAADGGGAELIVRLGRSTDENRQSE